MKKGTESTAEEVRSVMKLRIEPAKKWKLLDFKELSYYKDLLYFFILRDFTVQFKQTILGLLWAIINPVFQMIVFSVVFGKLAEIRSDGIPYPIFSFSGILPFNYFSQSLSGASGSLVGNANLLTKVYFPRILIPVTPVLSKLADFGIAFIILIMMMLYYGITPTLSALYLPLLIIMMILTSLGIGMWLSSLAIQYRDVKFALGFINSLLLYTAPVVFPASLILEKYGQAAYVAYAVYPMVGVIEGFRASLLGFNPMPWDLIAVGAVSSVLLFVSGSYYFKRTERIFADVA